jgi:hypothetical protein
MKKMNKLKSTKELVKSILEEVEETRSSDMQLYFEVCNRINPESLDAPFCVVIMNLDKLHLPPFESVRRSRQKIQAECPHLAASPEIQIFRAENEEVYRDFARGGTR